MKKAHCRKCGYSTQLGARVGWKVGLGLTALATGGASRSRLSSVLGGLAGLALGHYLDTHLLPDCPRCQVALQVLEPLVGGRA
jgi:hypothetical protein